MLEEETALLKGTEGSQVTGSKHKKIAARDEEEQRPFKKSRGKQQGKYHRGAAVKIGVLTVKIVDGGLHFLFFSFLFSLFFFLFLFLFLFLETARVRVCLSRCHISHKLMA